MAKKLNKVRYAKRYAKLANQTKHANVLKTGRRGGIRL